MPRLLRVSIQLLWLLAVACAAWDIPQFKVSLNEKPFKRWRAIAEKYGPTVTATAKAFVEENVPKEYMPLFRPIAMELDTFLDEPYRSELKGFAHYGKVPLEDLVALQVVYDFTAFCTSIVCVNSDNIVWHARNLDYGFNQQSTDYLKALTVSVRLTYENDTVVDLVTFAGLLGTVTGIRPGAFSVTLNERDQGSLNANLVSALKEILSTKRLRPVSLLLRDVLETARDYRSALKRLSTARFIAPAYIVLGGLAGNEGAVVTRTQERAVDVWTLNATAGRWFLLETNYDHWEPVPASDNRRDPGVRAMRAMGRWNVTKVTLAEVLATPLVLNNGTVFTSVMSASSDFIDSFVP